MGAIAGGVVGALAFLALLVVGLFFWRRWKRSQPIEEAQIMPTPFDPRPSWNQPPIPVDVTPKAQPEKSKSRNQAGPSVSSSHTSVPSSSNSGELHGSTTQLRTEMEEIRREMEEMRSGRTYEEPPPLYDRKWFDQQFYCCVLTSTVLSIYMSGGWDATYHLDTGHLLSFPPFSIRRP